MKRNREKPGAGEKLSSPFLPADTVDAILDWMEQRHLEEFEFEQGDLRLRLRRDSAGGSPAAASRPVPASRAVASVPPPAPSEPAEDLHVIKSPIVGTFYATPAPNAAPFVKVGDKVDVGKVLCIVEAMKLMNEIESDAAGEIVAIHGVNAQPVEYGQPLFSIRPARR